LFVVILLAGLSPRWSKNIPTRMPAIPTGPTIPSSGGFIIRWVKASGRLALHVIPEWAAIALLLGAVRTWFFPFIHHPLGFGIWACLGLAVAGTLFVIPTAGEIPIAEALLATGSAPGLAGALLITLPSISLPSMVMTRLAFPVKILLYASITVALVGIVTGLFTEWAF